MIVYRICKAKYADELNGAGAEKYGGRWNSKGVPMLYTSSSISLCTLEMLVQLNHQIVPNDFVLLYIELPKTLACKIVLSAHLPQHWHYHPPIKETAKIGDSFVKNGNNLCMYVPSAVVINENNILLNPLSTHFKDIKIVKKQKYQIDGRLLLGN